MRKVGIQNDGAQRISFTPFRVASQTRRISVSVLGTPNLGVKQSTKPSSTYRRWISFVSFSLRANSWSHVSVGKLFAIHLGGVFNLNNTSLSRADFHHHFHLQKKSLEPSAHSQYVEWAARVKQSDITARLILLSAGTE